MATITAAKAGNWSDTATWNGGVVPGNGDTADMNGYLVTQDIPTIPASGTLLAIQSPGTVGQLLVPMNTLAANCTINATTMTSGTGGSIIRPSGAAAAYTLTINCSNLNASPTTASIYGLYNTSSCAIIINGNVNGGAASATHGAGQVGGGLLTVNGNITGGSGVAAHGVLATEGSLSVTGNITGGSGAGSNGVLFQGTGTFTLNATAILTNGSGGMAISGKTPVWTPAADAYWAWSGFKLAKEPAAASVIEGVTVGSVEGTYHEAAEAEVEDGVTFGPSQSYTGTYTGGVKVIED